ncbi:ATP-binding cassette sub-family G member 1-like [Lycorma delicatula]|uniref:ATP-binding cassette sub-family G member 1-like n=1 Tax=Lycorma delicatula TaxID=130591 RepID=UPI003F516ED5
MLKYISIDQGNSTIFQQGSSTEVSGHPMRKCLGDIDFGSLWTVEIAKIVRELRQASIWVKTEYSEDELVSDTDSLSRSNEPTVAELAELDELMTNFTPQLENEQEIVIVDCTVTIILEISLLERQECHNELVRASGNGQNLGTCSASVYKEEFEINDSMNGIKSFGVIHRKQCCTNIFKQSFILLHRNAIRLYREKTLIRAHLIFHIVIGFLIGLLYHGIGSDAAFVFDNFSFIFFCLMFLMFTSFSAMIMAFPSELTIVIREYFNCWYSLKSYYFSVVMADIIFQIICTTTYCSLVYMITSQPRDMQRFILFTLMYILASLVSQGIGLFVGASMRIEHGMVFGALFIAPWVIFSGFFLHLSDAAPWFHWIFHISFLKHGLEGVMEALYGYNRPRLSCSIDYCHFISPKKLLKEFDMLHNDYWTNFYILFSYIVVIYIITYFMLKYQVYHKM